jgi:hypothetical protein
VWLLSKWIFPENLLPSINFQDFDRVFSIGFNGCKQVQIPMLHINLVKIKDISDFGVVLCGVG